ncbi:NAD-dependent epimerase/dehydratase family protein [Arthrobacter globiformis]|uniref:NAD-dependent epimerase/dehydratase family protein n=1 Tax=Arthrobacter globiformis TaxID=1665 RepID=UPI0015533764|nr:NAD-dependent epimerase/dehydratase family protein [Arthrobacter globiformis]
MKTLVIGADGFIGRSFCRVLGPEHEVVVGARTVVKDRGRCQYIDLLQPSSIAAALANVQPDVIVNCAGVMTTPGSASNTAMTGNLLQEVLESGLDVHSVVICGSASAYGSVEPDALPVPESHQLRATSLYGRDKVREECLGRLYRYSFGIPVVTARIFNPIGPGMQKRQLLPAICRQLQQWKAGRREHLEVTRLDAARDYHSAVDAARGLAALAYGRPREFAYNIGSGKQTSNAALLQRVFTLAGLDCAPPVRQSCSTPELPLASQADTHTINSEFGWTTAVPLDHSILEVLDESVR